MDNKITLALPKGRILQELTPLLEQAGIIPESDFFNENSRQLKFSTNQNIDIIRIRSFDVATFISFGAADIGVVGSDVLDEFGSKEIYSPLNLNIGKCRMSVAAPLDFDQSKDKFSQSHIQIATKYPNITQKYFANKGIQAECIKLNGAMELAPSLGLCHRIVDLVSTGGTLKANGLKEIEKISDVASYLSINRTAYKTKAKTINAILDNFTRALTK